MSWFQFKGPSGHEASRSSTKGMPRWGWGSEACYNCGKHLHLFGRLGRPAAATALLLHQLCHAPLTDGLEFRIVSLH